MTALDYLKSKERNVNLGQKVENRSWQPYITITLADNTQYPYKGLVDFAEPQVDPLTGTFSVRAEMPNPDHVLLPGQFDQSAVVARRARKRRNRTYESRHHRKRRGLHICGS